MDVIAKAYRQTDGTWLACIDSTYRTYGLDVTAELAARSAAMILEWAVHPKPVDVELRIVSAPAGAEEPVHHPGREPGNRDWPQFWIVVPVKMTRIAKWEYRARFDLEGHFSGQGSCDTVESTLETVRRVFRRIHGLFERPTDAGDFVFEAELEPESRNFDDDDEGEWQRIPGTTARYRVLSKEEAEARRERSGDGESE